MHASQPADVQQTVVVESPGSSGAAETAGHKGLVRVAFHEACADGQLCFLAHGIVLPINGYAVDQHTFHAVSRIRTQDQIDQRLSPQSKKQIDRAVLALLQREGDDLRLEVPGL